MGAKSGMWQLQTQGEVGHSVCPLYPLSHSQDNRLHAEAVHGRGVICYFSAGRVGSPPTLDMAYAVGGYLWIGSPPEACWVGVDPTYGAALLLWHPDRGLRSVYRVSLPSLIQLRGYFPDGTVLLEKGILQKDFSFVHSDFALVKLSEMIPERVDETRTFRQLLPRYQVLPQPKSARGTVSVPMITEGEYPNADSRFFIRVALGEGEVKLGSVCRNRLGVVQRASETLRDICSILWHPFNKDSVLASTNAVYSERSGIYKWTPMSARWQVVRTFPNAVSCQLLEVSSDGVTKLKVTDRRRTRIIEVSL